MEKVRPFIICLAALGSLVCPAAALPTSRASDVPNLPNVYRDPPPLENRAGRIGELARSRRPTLSGTLIQQSAATTTWFLYPGACVERALGTWAAKSAPVADSLQPTVGFPNSSGYTDNQPDIPGGNNTIAYTRADLSLDEVLWHVADAATDPTQRPSSAVVGTPNGIIDGSRMLWCGKYDANWVIRVGYPNVTNQILYIDTGTHAATTYTLSFEGNIGVEQSYDFVYFIGGGGSGQSNHFDPLQNRRDLIDDIIGAGVGGPHGDSELLVTFTGSIQTPQSLTAAGQVIEGAGFGQPSTVSYSVTIESSHRALYVVFVADCLYSSEDGLWPEGAGPCMDLVSTTEGATTLSLFDDQMAGSALDPFAGTVLTGTYGVAGCISARVSPGVGELWQLAPGSENPTNDACSLQKQSNYDLFFEGGEPSTNLAVNKQFNSIVSCTMPIPAGAGSVIAQWDWYLDLPFSAGYVGYAEYRFHKDGSWSNWQGTSPSGGVVVGAFQAWAPWADELVAAAQSDSVQLRWNFRCIPAFALDLENCASSQSNALLYDNFRLEVITGVPAPVVAVFPGGLAQTTFIDGTIKGTNCQVVPCWPGPIGTDVGGIEDNWNSPGDFVNVSVLSALRKDGMGVNWKRGFDLSIDAGETIARTNGAYNPAHDFPRMIFRLFDPATKTWSPFDSTELIAHAVTVSGTDTIVINSDFRIDWPPYDKIETGSSLPSGFSVNGVANYAGLAFLPRGTRMQYYFKGVDINGGVTYAFTSELLAHEVEDLPALPGGSTRATDIIEFRVLPSVYAPGPAGSLLAGRSDTPVLYLDSAYQGWSFGYDPVVEALRALGVRADRYRRSSVGIGGHRLPGLVEEVLPGTYPNYLEYPIVDSLAKWYRIIIESGHEFTGSTFGEQDAIVVEQWWRHDTGGDGGDRCILLTGDNQLYRLLNNPVSSPFRNSLAQQVFGVSAATTAWGGTSATAYPTIDDRFGAAAAGPGLAPPNSFTYAIDGGCPGPNRFDAIVPVSDIDAMGSAFYPNGQVAGVARSRELDNIDDKDRSKSLAYGYSIQFVRDPAYGPTNPNYGRSGVENRVRLLYKFLTGCRGPRTPALEDTGKCWPCPTAGTTLSLMQADWSNQASEFQTDTWGPLYPIQAAGLATAVGESGPEAEVPRVNTLGQNRPNPFNPETVIPYRLAQSGRVVIRIFDVRGRRVRTLVDRVEQAGEQVARWDGKTDGGEHAASGVYLYRITYPNGEVSAKKLAVVR